MHIGDTNGKFARQAPLGSRFKVIENSDFTLAAADEIIQAEHGYLASLFLANLDFIYHLFEPDLAIFLHLFSFRIEGDDRIVISPGVLA
jgi:hypothetical protein